MLIDRKMLVSEPVADERIVFDARFSRMPGIAHEGYAAGVIAAALGGGDPEVQLRRPVPTGRALTLERGRGPRVELRDGDVLLADAVAAHVPLDVPPPVTPADANAAARRFPGFRGHAFPDCFCCGPEHPAGGLRIFPGPVTGRRLVAAPWMPDPETAADDGRLRDELVWAALACAPLWALVVHAPPSAPRRLVTAALATTFRRPVRADEPHVVMAWPIGREGRRFAAGAAVLGPNGEICAVGRQTAAAQATTTNHLRRRHDDV